MTPIQKPKLHLLTGFNKKALQITSDLNELTKDLTETIATIILEPKSHRIKRDDNNTRFIYIKGKVELKSNDGIIYTSNSMIISDDGYPELVREIRGTDLINDTGTIRYTLDICAKYADYCVDNFDVIINHTSEYIEQQSLFDNIDL